MFFIFGSEGLNYKTFRPGYHSIRFSWSIILHTRSIHTIPVTAGV